MVFRFRYFAFPDSMSRQPLKDKLSQKLWSGLCFVAKAFALAPLSPNIHPDSFILKINRCLKGGQSEFSVQLPESQSGLFKVLYGIGVRNFILLNNIAPFLVNHFLG